MEGSSLSTSEFPETIGRIVRLATPPKVGAGAVQDALHRVHRLTKQQGRDLVALAQKLMAAQRKEALAVQARQAGGAGAAGLAGGPAQQVRPEVKEHAAHYLRSWYILCQKGMLPRVAPVPPEEAPETLTTFFSRMQQGGLLTASNRTWRQMMSALIELAVDQALQGLSPAAAEGAPPPDYSAIDSLASLIVNAVKYYPAGADNQARLGFFDWTMSIIADHMLADQRRRGPAWNQRPFFRLLLEIIQTVGDSDPCLDVDVQTNVVIAMASSSETLHVLRFQLIKVCRFAIVCLVVTVPSSFVAHSFSLFFLYFSFVFARQGHHSGAAQAAPRGGAVLRVWLAPAHLAPLVHAAPADRDQWLADAQGAARRPLRLPASFPSTSQAQRRGAPALQRHPSRPPRPLARFP